MCVNELVPPLSGRAMQGESSLPTSAGVPGGGNEEMLEDGDPRTSGSIQLKPISTIPMSVKVGVVVGPLSSVFYCHHYCS